MGNHIRYIVLGLFALVCCSVSECRAQDTVRTDSADMRSIHFALLTCTPGTDAYAHFGHTAILKISEQQSTVYNYGCFDATQKYFLFNFIAGNTNYLLEDESLLYFLQRYHYMGNGVTMQLLNLKDAENERLSELLAENMQTENQTYLYNWLYDNCTERARDIIEKAIEGEVVYPEATKKATVRDMLHAKLTDSPWLQLGIDMVLGEEIDREAETRTMMFIPDFYQAELSGARIKESDGTERKLVENNVTLLTPTPVSHADPLFITPMMVFSLILILSICISIYNIVDSKRRLWFDAMLLTAQGLAGCIVAYLFFFSKHPAVDSNWLVVVFNPLFLVYGIMLFMGKQKPVAEYANLAVLIAFLVIMQCAGQWFNPIVYLMLSALLIRSCMRLIMYNRHKNSNTNTLRR